MNHHIRKYELEDLTFVRALLESLHVDDMSSGDNEVKKIKALFGGGRFQLTKMAKFKSKIDGAY